ncbi:nucleotidyl transferase AbiEii/AbiGii toxin family protein [Microbacterium xylanilyticum]
MSGDDQSHLGDNGRQFASRVKSTREAGVRPAVPGVLDEDERLSVELAFAVDSSQVQRDHVISHALAAISTIGTDDVLFFGGTALSRTHFPDLRLSEDIDLIALGDRKEIGDRIESAIKKELRRSLGTVAFAPRIRDTNHPEPSAMTVSGVRIQIQLLGSDGYPEWPTEVVQIEQRYSDAPPATLRVPTGAGFVASKLAAWNDRGAARDLYDLWAMAEDGMIDADAAAVFGRLGPVTRASAVSFARIPSRLEWDAALAHQCVVQVSADRAAARVRLALQSL